VKKLLLTITALALLGYLAAAPYITAQQMKNAAQDYDGKRLSEFVDFAALQDSLTKQITAVALGEKGASNNALAVLGSQVADATVRPIVKAYVTPEGVIELMAGSKPKLGKLPKRDGNDPQIKNIMQDATLGYDGPHRFTIGIHAQGSERVRLVLHRYGMHWKLAEVVF